MAEKAKKAGVGIDAQLRCQRQMRLRPVDRLGIRVEGAVDDGSFARRALSTAHFGQGIG